MKETIDQFVTSMRQLGIMIPDGAIEVVEHGCPHAPRTLPPGKMAVYCFHEGGKFLKIGKAGPNSNNRFYWDHYRTKAFSSLAKSLLRDVSRSSHGLDELNVGAWIKQSLHRTDILVDASLSIHVLTLLESFLICAKQPVYEGHEGQRAD